jgi:hypothetical protein
MLFLALLFKEPFDYFALFAVSSNWFAATFIAK